MREVAPGDLIFSFMDARILAVGIAQSYCWESPKPPVLSASRDVDGQKRDVVFVSLARRLFQPAGQLEQ